MKSAHSAISIPPAIRGAVHRGDDRHRAVDHGADRALEDQVLILPLLVGHAVALFQIAAGAERLRGPAPVITMQRCPFGAAQKPSNTSSRSRPICVFIAFADLRPVQRHQHGVLLRVLDA